jgi:hypothetical protein
VAALDGGVLRRRSYVIVLQIISEINEVAI